MPIVHSIITIRSVKLPRTAATAKANTIEMMVCKIVSGMSKVSEGPSRVVMICDTDSPVLQLSP